MRLASVFSDHAVLQRDMSIPIWGWTEPCTRVSVKLGEVEALGISSDDGKFLVRLPPQPAGGPFTLVARNLDLDRSVSASDIHVGEVWLASGQSNMDWTMSATGAVGDTEIASAEDPLLRMMTLTRLARLGRSTGTNGRWQCCSSANTGRFSAVAYYFAKRLRQELGVAVGILSSSWGGTIVEAWTGREWLQRNPHTADLIARYESDIHSPTFWSKHASLCRPFPADPGNKGFASGWADPAFETTAWREAELPATWQSLGHPFSGVFWFRKTVDIPAAWAGKALSLNIGAVDKHDITYFNNQQVGATGKGLDESYWDTERNYSVPADLVKAGANTITVRAYSFVFAGGMIGPADRMTLAPADGSGQPIPLSGSWRYEIEHNLGQVIPPSPPPGPNNPNTPYILHDSMIVPLQPYALRGAIWYQGESNAGRHSEYRSLLTDMIRCWRTEWGQGDFPFLIVQLANFTQPLEYQPESSWARLREAQLHTLSEPNTGLAVTIDIGDAKDIHPRNKHDVGRRLAQWALARTYHKPIVPSGPIYHSMSIEGSRIRVRFEYVGDRLVSTGGPLQTFFIAGADRVFKKAEALIDGATVLVSSPEVTAPVAVRYAWADNPEGCNLHNASGLPASPFRTDRWS